MSPKKSSEKPSLYDWRRYSDVLSEGTELGDQIHSEAGFSSLSAGTQCSELPCESLPHMVIKQFSGLFSDNENDCSKRGLDEPAPSADGEQHHVLLGLIWGLGKNEGAGCS